MVKKLIKKLHGIYLYIKVIWYFLKFAYRIATSSDYQAQILITRAKWRINNLIDDIDVKEFFMDYVKSCERIRFNIDNGQDNISQTK